jgi:hypothetical protein
MDGKKGKHSRRTEKGKQNKKTNKIRHTCKQKKGKQGADYISIEKRNKHKLRIKYDAQR